MTEKQFARALAKYERDLRRSVRALVPLLLLERLASVLVLVLVLVLASCGDDAPPATDAGPCECAFALCRSDGTCWCPTDAGEPERCEAP